MSALWLATKIRWIVITCMHRVACSDAKGKKWECTLRFRQTASSFDVRFAWQCREANFAVCADAFRHVSSLQNSNKLRPCSSVLAAFNSLAIRGLCLKHAVDGWKIPRRRHQSKTSSHGDPMQLHLSSLFLTIFYGIWTSVLLHKLCRDKLFGSNRENITSICQLATPF